MSHFSGVHTMTCTMPEGQARVRNASTLTMNTRMNASHTYSRNQSMPPADLGLLDLFFGELAVTSELGHLNAKGLEALREVAHHFLEEHSGVRDEGEVSDEHRRRETNIGGVRRT